MDFIRGIAILDMMIVHYSGWLDDLRLDIIGKIIRYTDFAVEAFIFLAGFIAGSYYLAAFRLNASKISRKLLRRAAQIVGIQYFMIATLSIPTAFAVGQTLTVSDSVTQFAVRSFLFLNQVPLLHILPTFIPLFLMSIPILYALKRNWDAALLGISICLFAFGHWQPYLPISGADKAIFPPILWQIYFVVGVILGKHRMAIEAFLKRQGKWNVLLSLAGFLVMAAVLHGHHWAPQWGSFLQENHLVVRKFPLNWLGLLYHGSILYLVIALTTFVWTEICRFETVVNSLTSLGRNGLAIFVIHVYICFAITYWFNRSILIALPFIALNIIGSFWVARLLDTRGVIRSHTPVAEPRSA